MLHVEQVVRNAHIPFWNSRANSSRRANLKSCKLRYLAKIDSLVTQGLVVKVELRSL